MGKGRFHVWGMEEDECRLPFPADTVLARYDEAWFRGVTVEASRECVFRWLCQMRVAPYSYDWIDNLGRRSPQHLTPGLDKLETGQRLMFVFELTDFVRNEHLTIRTPQSPFFSGLLGDSALSYRVVPQTDDACRILVKINIRYPRGPIGWLMRLTLPLADLIMMRRQLLNFKRLAEVQQQQAETNPGDTASISS